MDLSAQLERSNRTFMELKYGQTDNDNKHGDSSNRTFMELKYNRT